jgi:DNA-binding CsgD family transcriptional regulator
MKPILVRPLTPGERAQLRAGLRSPSAFTLRRCQCLLASAAGQTPAAIAATYGGSGQAVRNLIRDFAARGTACLVPRPSTPRRPRAAWPRGRDADLRALAHQSPRALGKPTSLWTLDLLAAVCHEKGWTQRLLSGEAIRLVFKRLGVSWKRAKHWLTSPDPAYAAKKKPGTT